MTVRLPIGGQRRKDPLISKFRMATEKQIRELPHGSRQYFIANDGLARMATITSVKTWKTRPGVSVGVKYGLYEYARWNLPESLRRIMFKID